jgi:hypothetical protein
VPDQPLPTLADLADFHRDMGRGLHQSCPDAWHEAAARQLDYLAGQGREVERLRAVLSNLVWVKDYKDRNGKDSTYRTVQSAAWEAARAALAAPPVEEPR